MFLYFFTFISIVYLYPPWAVYSDTQHNFYTHTPLSSFTINDEMLIHSTLGKELVHEIRRYAPNYPFAASHVNKALMEASETSSLPNPEDDVCERDYASPCPLHWFPSGDGPSCIAGSSYSGQCGPRQDFSDFTPLKKRQFSSECNTAWPCKKPFCIQDINAPCPHNFNVQDDGTCLASDTYHGRCIRNVSFKQLSPAHRLIWAELCNVNWPCLSSYTSKTGSMCPLRWTLSHSTRNCIAPLNYLGPCSPVQPVSTPPQIMINQCNANYGPKTSRSNAFTIPTCDQDFKDPCPFTWKLLHSGNALCTAPPSYKGQCPWRFSFWNYTEPMKKAFSLVCKVTWPCSDSGQSFNKSVPNEQLYSNPLNPLSLKKDFKDDLVPIINHKTSFDKTIEDSHRVENQGNIFSPIHNSKRNKKHQQFWGEFLSLVKDHIPQVLVDSAREAQRQLNRRRKDVVLDFRFRDTPMIPHRHSILTSKKNKTIDTLGERFPFDSVNRENEEKHRTESFRFVSKHYRIQRYAGSNSEIYARFIEQLSNNLTARLDPYGGHINILDSKLLNSKCARDYTKPCPLGWKTLSMSASNGVTSDFCVAKNFRAVSPNCNYVEPFGRMSSEEKMAVEITCNVAWPCRQCHHDYVRSYCPQGWMHEGDGVCRKSQWIRRQEELLQSDEMTSEWCGNVVNFKYMVPELRQLWAPIPYSFAVYIATGKACGYDWPCFEECERDFSFPCPLDWILQKPENKKAPYSLCIPSPLNPQYMKDIVTVSCVAVDTQRFPCGTALKVPFNLVDRYLLEAQCDVQWPCRKLCCPSSGQTCPSGFFYNPANYTCIPFLVSHQPLDQLRYENSCKKIETPCNLPCQLDFTYPCPRGWNTKFTSGRVLCLPNTSYKGPCQAKKYDVTDANQLTKWLFTWRCEAISLKLDRNVNNRALLNLVAR